MHAVKGIIGIVYYFSVKYINFISFKNLSDTEWILI